VFGIHEEFVAGYAKGTSNAPLGRYTRQPTSTRSDVDKDDEYRDFFSYTDKLMERRKSVTTTYLTVNTAITTAMAFLLRDAQLSRLPERLSILFLLLFGIVASALWFTLIRQHSTLIGWWYAKLRVLESNLDNSSRLINKEYDELYSKERSNNRLGLTRYEISLSVLFGVIYIVFALGVLLGPKLGLA